MAIREWSTAVFILFLAVVFGARLGLSVRAASTDTIEGTIQIAVCGNEVREDPEECDNDDLAGQSCTDFGYSGGSLSCLPACEFDVSQCTSGGGEDGGAVSGGGGGYRFPFFFYPPPPSVPSPEVLSRLDFNGDSRIDIADLSILLFYWQQNGPDAADYDLNQDGIVDIADVSVLLYYWTG